MHRTWNIVYFGGLICLIGIRHLYARQTLRNELVVKRRDAVDKFSLLLVTAGSILTPLLYLFTPWLNFADYSLPPLVPWFGLGVMVVALWLFWRSHADLGQNWSVTLAVRKDHQLITRGVYRSIRHPMYASLWLWKLAQGLLLSNWLAGWFGLISFFPLYFYRTPREEEMMCEAFGPEYEDYMRRTGRIVPRLKFQN
jgi:protein-S-isoprenylcysteine O-methyltransferase Ste14